VFGVLNMLVSVASFLPILIVGPIGDLIGPTAVLVTVALLMACPGSPRSTCADRCDPSSGRPGGRRQPGDPFVEALGAEIAGPEDFLDEDGDGIPDATGPARRSARASTNGSTATDSTVPLDPSREQDPDLDREHDRDPRPAG
jgi:hypothetical protein